MRVLERAAYQARRVAQTPRTFTNWGPLLRGLVAERIGRGGTTLDFTTRDGLHLSCPNLPGARLPMYEQFAVDCYRRDWVLGSEESLSVLDVGSHVGAFATNLASAGSHVQIECYEPSAQSARFLRDNLDRNGLADRVRVHEQALAAEVGVALLDDNGAGSVHNGLLRDNERLVAGDDAWGERGAVEVATTTFDAAVAAAVEATGRPFDVVKMDCEGGEYDLVYASAPASWASVRRVVMEYHPVPGHSWSDLRAWLGHVGLKVVRHEPLAPGLGTAWLAREDEMTADSPVRTPAEQVRHEADEWHAVATEVLGPDAQLVSVSRWFPDSRVYRSAGRVAKIRWHDPRPGGWNGVHNEADLLRHLGRQVESGTFGRFDWSVQPELSGTTFSTHLFDQQENAFSTRERAQVLRRTVSALGDLHRRGVAHGDLRPDNILVEGGPAGAVRLVDFDMATRHSRLGAAYRDWIGFGGELGVRHPLWKLVLFTLFPKTQTLLLRLRHALGRAGRRPAAGPDESGDVRTLREAWRLAESSDANARGQGMAYYALTYRGAHLTGERSWHLRWDALARSVDFGGKSLLELGCNMGLLSSYARLAGTGDVHGVDHDQRIVDAATTVAEALGSGATFERLDLTGGDDWEARLGGRDIVSALSVVHWLPDPDRVLRFLGKHDEVLYEGHQSLAEETALLNGLGFDDVRVVMETERKRHLLHARRTGSAGSGS